MRFIFEQTAADIAASDVLKALKNVGQSHGGNMILPRIVNVSADEKNLGRFSPITDGTIHYG